MTAGAVTSSEIPALNHEIVDDAMEDGAVVVPVFNEEFEVFNVDRGVVRIELDGHGAGVGTAVPGQFQIHDVGGRAASVGDVDARQHQNDGEENGHDARWGWRTVVDESRERGFTDAFLLHLVEQFVVGAVGFFISGILFCSVPQKRRGPTVVGTIVSRFGIQPRGVASESQRRLFGTVGVDISQNLER